MRDTSWPVSVDPTTRPMETGIRLTPARVADTPITLTMNSGRKTIRLRNAAPVKKRAGIEVA